MLDPRISLVGGDVGIVSWGLRRCARSPGRFDQTRASYDMVGWPRVGGGQLLAP
ncbi:hypothetical protein FB565_003392 [Actinoplanes lutulentus]|uniref:hypothetical protein n=1 Tax=Actinoplanes lutulentus TaxID=1287878 RepID=UPI0015EC362E|nr:hypothetical protein [Actinoplanes lutulentus]MBB2943663.1 hypothetical protein [Actinoplanes lutulentus]